IQRVAAAAVERRARAPTAGGWSRPDWWAQIAGRSQARLFARLAGLVKQGIMPVLIEADALWVVSHDPSPVSAVPGLLSAKRWSGYTPCYEVALPLTVADI